MLTGEALSKQHLQQSNLIKKLRSKATEREQSAASLTDKLAKAEAENKTLKEVTNVHGFAVCVQAVLQKTCHFVFFALLAKLPFPLGLLGRRRLAYECC